MLHSPLKGMDTLSGVASLSDLTESNFFPFRVNPFSEGVWFARMQTESHKSYLPWEKRVEKPSSVSNPLR